VAAVVVRDALGELVVLPIGLRFEPRGERVMDIDAFTVPLGLLRASRRRPQNGGTATGLVGFVAVELNVPAAIVNMDEFAPLASLMIERFAPAVTLYVPDPAPNMNGVVGSAMAELIK
jgi:hypothetical protein